MTPTMNLLPLIPSLVALALFVATCNLNRKPKAKAPAELSPTA